MLQDGQKLFAYNFSGYWKDVGTVASLWEANMDLLRENSGLKMDDSGWKIYARNTAEPPHFVGNNACIENSIITEGCEIDGTVVHSVISTGVKIGKGAVVKGCNIMSNAVIEDGAQVSFSIVGPKAVIGKNAIVGGVQEKQGEGEEYKITVVGPKARVEENQVVPVKAMID